MCKKDDMLDNNGSEDIKIDKDNISSLAEIIVRQKLSENYKTLSNGAKIYILASGWETSIIEDSNNIAIASTLSELEFHIKDENCKNILIKLGSLISDEGIERICTRNGSTKAIFKEVKD